MGASKQSVFLELEPAESSDVLDLTKFIPP